MKEKFLMVVFAFGCAGPSETARVDDSSLTPTQALNEGTTASVVTSTNTDWPDHFAMLVNAEVGHAQQTIKCTWRLNFKRSGKVYRVSGAELFPELKPITTPEEGQELDKKLACLMPAFTVDADTKNLLNIEVMECVADLRKTFMEYGDQTIPEAERYANADMRVDSVTERARQHVNWFSPLLHPLPPALMNFREGEVRVSKRKTTTAGKIKKIAGYDCLEVQQTTKPYQSKSMREAVNLVAQAQGREPVDRVVIRSSWGLCFSKEFSLILASSSTLVFVEPASEPTVRMVYDVEDFRILDSPSQPLPSQETTND